MAEKPGLIPDVAPSYCDRGSHKYSASEGLLLIYCQWAEGSVRLRYTNQRLGGIRPNG